MNACWCSAHVSHLMQFRIPCPGVVSPRAKTALPTSVSCPFYTQSPSPAFVKLTINTNHQKCLGNEFLAGHNISSLLVLNATFVKYWIPDANSSSRTIISAVLFLCIVSHRVKCLVGLLKLDCLLHLFSQVKFRISF